MNGISSFFERPADLSKLERILDNEIRKVNTNYNQKRVGGIALDNLKIIELPSGSIDAYFRKYGNIGGQSKLPKLRNDRNIAERLQGII